MEVGQGPNWGCSAKEKKVVVVVVVAAATIAVAVVVCFGIKRCI
jgi:hypothetical protein